MNNGQPGEQPTEGQEFDRLFALDEPDEGTEVQTPAPAAPAPAAAAGEGENTGGQSASGDGGESGGTPTEQPAATGTTEDDWLASANLPDDVVARIKADREARDAAIREEQNRYQALHGRLAPTQQALADAQRRLAQMSRPAPSGETVQQTPPVMQPGQSMDSFFDSDDWKAYASDYPGDAKVMRAAIEANAAASQSLIQQLDARINQLTKRLAQTEQVTTRAVVNEEISLLEKRHPDWMDINQSDDFWGWFEQWRATQPKSVRGQYYDEARLGEMFNDAEWTGNLIDSYKATRQQQTATQQQVPPVQQPKPESTAPAQQQPASNGRLAMSVAPTVRGGAPVPHAVSLDGLSEAEAFDVLWKQSD